MEEKVVDKVVEIRLIAKECQSQNGRSFTAFKAVKKDGSLIDTKFTRACKNIPAESCTIRVKASNCNETTNTLYPTLWIKDVEEIINKDGSKASVKNAQHIVDMFE